MGCIMFSILEADLNKCMTFVAVNLNVSQTQVNLKVSTPILVTTQVDTV